MCCLSTGARLMAIRMAVTCNKTKLEPIRKSEKLTYGYGLLRVHDYRQMPLQTKQNPWL